MVTVSCGVHPEINGVVREGAEVGLRVVRGGRFRFRSGPLPRMRTAIKMWLAVTVLSLQEPLCLFAVEVVPRESLRVYFTKLIKLSQLWGEKYL